MLKISHNPQHNQFLAQMMKVLTVNHLHPSFKSRFNCENIKEGINNQTCPQIKKSFFYNKYIYSKLLFWTQIVITEWKKSE